MTDRREIKEFTVWRSARTFGIDFYRNLWESTRPPAGLVMDIETARTLRDALDRQIAYADFHKWSPPDLDDSGPAEDLVSAEVHGHS